MKHVLFSLIGIVICFSSFAQTGTLAAFQKISSTSGGLTSSLAPGGGFGRVSESSADHVIFTSAPNTGNGEVTVLSLETDGTIRSEFKISADQFDFFNGRTNSEFGYAVVDIGDINSDGMNEIVAGAPGIEGGRLFLLTSEDAEYELTELSLPLALTTVTERLGEHLFFHEDLLYASSMHGSGNIYQFQIDASNSQLTVLETIDENHSKLLGKLEDGDRFGSGMSFADVNQDGIADILCGAPGDDDQDINFGAIYLLYGGSSELVSEVQKISRMEGDFGGFLNIDDEFGSSVRAIGDLDENGTIDIAVGAPGDDNGGTNIGTVWILFMHEDGWVINEKKINRFEGNFTFDLSAEDRLAERISTVGDLNNDGTIDLAVSAAGDDDGEMDTGALYIFFIERCLAPSGDFDFSTDGTTVSFTAEGGPGYSYIWNFDDGGFSEEQNPVHTFQNTGTYMVCLAINSECGGDNFCENVQVTSVLSDSNLEKIDFTVYPNPAKDRLQLKGWEENARFKIIDVTGKTVDSGILTNYKEIDVSSLNEGIYLLNLEKGTQKVVKKFQVMR